MKRIVALLVLTWLCSSVNAAQPSKEILAIRDAVKETLKDPDSAKFKTELVSGNIVCGEVNAKNSYGGYSGGRKYMAVDGTITFENESKLFPQWWGENCYK